MNPKRIVLSYEWYKAKTFCCAFFAAAMLTMVAAATIVRFPPVICTWLYTTDIALNLTISFQQMTYYRFNQGSGWARVWYFQSRKCILIYRPFYTGPFFFYSWPPSAPLGIVVACGCPAVRLSVRSERRYRSNSFKDFSYRPEICLGWCTVRPLFKMAILGQFLRVPRSFEIFHDRLGPGPRKDDSY